MLLVLVGVGLMWLATVGFPNHVTDRVRETFAEQGYDVRIRHIRFTLLDGIIATHCHLYLHEDDRHPAIEAHEIVLGFNPREWLRGRHGLQRVRVRDGLFRVSLEGPLRELEDVRVVSLTGFRADIRLADSDVHIRDITAKFKDIEIEGHGRIYRDPDREPTDPPMTPQLLRETLDQHADWLPQWVEELDGMDFKAPPRLDFAFLVDQVNPDRNEMTLSMQGEGTRFRGLHFDGWEMEAQLAGQHLRVPLCKVYHGDRRLELRGALDMEKQVAEAKVYINLLPVYWRNLMPDVLRGYMEGARIHAFGPTEAELTVGPSPVAEFGRDLDGWIKAQEVEAHGVWIESIRAQVHRNGSRLEVSGIDARVGRDEAEGPAAGRIAYDLDENTYYGELKASLNPHAVLPVAGYSSNAAQIIESLTFDEALPTIDVVFSGAVAPNPSFHFTGDMTGQDFLYRGSRIRTFESTFHVTNRVMRLDPLYVKRDEGELTGWYEQNFNTRMTDLEIESSVDPKALARVGGGTVERILRVFRFEGPVEVHVSGRMDYGAHEQTDYIAVGRAEQVGWRWIQADSCEMEWIAQADRITMTNLSMEVYGGKLSGDVVLEGIGAEPVRYTVHARVSDVVFASLLREVRHTEEDLQEGSLSARIELTGLAEDDWRASLDGHGRVRIREGQVFQIPLLGGLSQLLGRIYPRLGFAVQTDARADFEIRDRYIASEEIRIEGGLLSLWGEGRYLLDDELDFKVQVRPLRRGFLVDAVRFFTYPVSRLLQFRLEGTLSDPHWRIDSIPRELWTIFERDE